MGVDTKGVVITNEKDFWKVSQLIGNALYTEIRKNLPEGFGVRGEDGGWELPKITISQHFHSLDFEVWKYFQFLFTWNGEDRMLSVHLNCDCDLQEEFGEGSQGIIMSLGMWGSSTEIMEVVLKNLTGLGNVYIQENDCSDDWKLLKEKTE